jgi:hypothetical protein
MRLCRDLELLKRLSAGEVTTAWGEIDGYSHKMRKDGVRNSLVNQLSRAKIRALRPCFIVKVNRYNKADPFAREYRRGMVCNFDGSFVLKTYDVELVRLLEERDGAQYTGTADDARRVEAIYTRMEALGGEILSWC